MRILLPFVIAALSLPASISAEVVPAAPFRSVDLRGGGDVTIVPGSVQRVTIVRGSSAYTRIYSEKEGQLRIDACNERCPRNYNLEIRIESPRLPGVAIMGGGTIKATGGFAPQDQVMAAINGGGQIDVRSVEGREVSAAVNGGGRILVRSRGVLNAAVRGGGEVRYAGNPQLSMAIAGGGDVRRID